MAWAMSASPKADMVTQIKSPTAVPIAAGTVARKPLPNARATMATA